MSHNNHTRYSKMYGEGNLTIDTFEPENKIETEPDPIEENESGYNESDRVEVEGQTEIEGINSETEDESESTVEEESAPEAITEPATFGQVFNCKKLNIRKFPDRGASIVSELVDGTKVQIDMKGSTTLFYKICTECGIEGYCMKNFIKVLP